MKNTKEMHALITAVYCITRRTATRIKILPTFADISFCTA